MLEFSPTDVQMAQVMYTTYGDEADWLTWDNRKMPTWSNLTPEVVNRWIAAAKGGQAYLESIKPMTRIKIAPAPNPDKGLAGTIVIYLVDVNPVRLPIDVESMFQDAIECINLAAINHRPIANVCYGNGYKHQGVSVSRIIRVAKEG